MCQRIILDNVMPLNSKGDPSDWNKDVLDCLHGNIVWDYDFYNNKDYAYIKYTENPQENLPTKAKLRLLKPQGGLTDMAKRLILLKQAQKGCMNTIFYKGLYSAHAGGNTDVFNKNTNLFEGRCELSDEDF